MVSKVVLFEDILHVAEVDPDGKRFDKGTAWRRQRAGALALLEAGVTPPHVFAVRRRFLLRSLASAVPGRKHRC
jgi:hypothetical protein